MIIHLFEHRGRSWNAMIHPAPVSRDDCEIELIFTAREAPDLKFVRPVGRRTLDAVTDAPPTATTVALLRELLDDAMREGLTEPTT